MNKKILSEKIISFGMGYCIKTYKNNPKDRNRAKRIVEHGADFIAIKRYFDENDSDKKNTIDLTNLNAMFFLSFLFFGCVSFFTVNYFLGQHLISAHLAAIIVISSTFFGAIRFKKNQCKYLLNNFNKIDDEQKEFNQKIVACNLYLK